MHAVISFVNPLSRFVSRRILFVVNPMWFIQSFMTAARVPHLLFFCSSQLFGHIFEIPNGVLSYASEIKKNKKMVTFARNSLVKKLKYIAHIRCAHLD